MDLTIKREPQMSETAVVDSESVEPGSSRVSSVMSDEQLIAMLVDRPVARACTAVDL